MSRPFDDLSGIRYGRWTVISYSHGDAHRTRYWLCRCDCGVEQAIRGRNLREGQSRSCGCHTNTGYGNLSGSYWATVISNARNRRMGEIPVEITIQYASNLLDMQDHKCALTGITIQGARLWKDRKIQTASLDRIDSNRGYLEDNVQWVHKDVNNMKGNFDQDYFIQLCKLIAKENT